jgi:hypothetical protein
MRVRRFWPFAALVVLGLALVSLRLAVDRYTQDPPNYSEIEHGLYLGGYVKEPPPGTQTVLNLCETEDLYQVESHRWEPIRDAEPAPTLEWLREQVAFIAKARSEGKTVFVHCLNGASRSGMVVVAYYMARNSWSRDEAMEFVRARRPGLRPNPAFRQRLLEWECSLKIGSDKT